MSTQFTNRQWRLPNNENKDKQSNYSMDFDGSSYIDCGNDSTLQITGDLTISMWFKTTSTSGYLVSDTPAIAGCYSILMGGGNGQLWVRRGNGTSTETTQKTSNTYNDGNWHNITLVSDSTMRIYVDGVLDVQSTINTPSSIGGTTTVKIGGGFSNFSGKLDAVAIFNYALSSSQVTTLYGSSSTGIGNPMSLSPKPVAMYNLGDKSAFNGANYLVPNSSLKDYVFDFESGNTNFIKAFNVPVTTFTECTISVWVKFELSLIHI